MDTNDEKIIFAWVEATVGEKILEVRRPGGLVTIRRPDWFITTSGNGGSKKYYVRCDRRPDFKFTKIYPLQGEAQLLRLLHREGIPVPQVLAERDNPAALLMEFVEGTDDFSSIGSPEALDSIILQFAGIAARWHAIPAQKFADIGFPLPRRREDYLAFHLNPRLETHFHALKEPVPLVTFACEWLRRNVPEPPARPVLIQGDSGPGQFLFKDGRIQAIIDWEIAGLGDPMQQLANIRTRDIWYRTGHLRQWFDYYSQQSGIALDYAKIRYYSVVDLLTTTLALSPVVQNLTAQDEHAEWIALNSWSKRAVMEALAETQGIYLPPVPLPEPKPTRASPLLEFIQENIVQEQLPHITDAYQRHRMTLISRMTTHIRHVSELGEAIEEMELADMERILGSRPRDIVLGTRQIEALVRTADADRDVELTHYFYRHAVREHALMRGGFAHAEDVTFPPLVGP